ncbi:MAG: FMN-dependent NADH-azoreductase [Armatimonadota bacterium]
MMATLLHILAHPQAHSRTVRIANAFLTSYQQTHPEDIVVTADLYNESISFLTDAHITAISLKGDLSLMTQEERSAWQEIDGRLRQFMSADKYVFTTPMWNFTIPAILKAYIDQVVIAGFTFRFTETGSLGLMRGRKAAIISTRGGVYSQPPMSEFEMTVSYLRAICTFMGIDVTCEVIAEALNIVKPGDEEERLMEAAITQARQEGANY